MSTPKKYVDHHRIADDRAAVRRVAERLRALHEVFDKEDPFEFLVSTEAARVKQAIIDVVVDQEFADPTLLGPAGMAAGLGPLEDEVRVLDPTTPGPADN